MGQQISIKRRPQEPEGEEVPATLLQDLPEGALLDGVLAEGAHAEGALPASMEGTLSSRSPGVS